MPPVGLKEMPEEQLPLFSGRKKRMFFQRFAHVGVLFPIFPYILPHQGGGRKNRTSAGERILQPGGVPLCYFRSAQTPTTILRWMR